MEPPFPGRREYGSEEQEEHRHSPFHDRPPPPPRPDDDEEGEGRFGGRRGDYEEGGYPPSGERRHGRRGDEEEERYGGGYDEGGFGRRRGEDGRFGRGGDEEGYPPEPPPRFPHLGFHGRPEPPRHEGPPPHDSYNPSHDAFSQLDAPPHSFAHSDSQHIQKPSAEYTRPEPELVKEEPVADASLSNQMDSLSLDLPQGRLVRIFCKENAAYNLAVDHNSLKMQDSNTEDESQQWIKDASHGMRIKDSYGYPAFSLVNKKTKKLLKHANEKGQQVLLVDYEAGLKDDNILWTESQDFGEGFKTLRSASDTLLNFTVFEGNKRIRNGSALVLDTWHKGDHQLWKLFPL